MIQSAIEAGHAASGGLTSPINGVIVDFTIRNGEHASVASNPPTPFVLRTFRRTSANNFTAVTSEAGSHTPTDTTNLQTFTTRLSIASGDFLGINANDPSSSPDFNAVGAGAGSSIIHLLEPAVADGVGATYLGFGGYEVLLRANVEADADTDGYGDETQDFCPGDPTRQTAPCAASSGSGSSGSGQAGSNPSDKTAPSVTLSSTDKQSVGKGITIQVQSNEPGIAAANATVNVPGASKTLKFKPVTASLVAGVKAKLRLKLSKKNVKAVRRAIHKGKKPKAKVTISVKDVAGNATNASSTVKLKR